MRDLELLEATAISLVELDESQLRWDSSRAALKTFKENFTRTARMIEAPIYAALTADAHRLALHHVFKGEPTIEQCEAYRGPIGEEMEKLMVQLLNVDKETQKQAMIYCAHNLNGFIQRTTNVHAIFESLLNAIIVQAWTSFEVLFSELHKLSRTEHPACFHHLDPALTFDFQKRETIRLSYKNAFRDNGRIKNVLNEQCVDALALLRNLIVHKGGVVDGMFHRSCEDAHLIAWADLPVPSQFPVSGKTVRSLIDPNAKCACRLIKSVDKWISDNLPTK